MINEFDKLLNDFKKIYREKSKKQTIFEISKFPHWETVSSNVLAFFFNPNEEHGLDNLLIKSLLESLGIKDYLGNLENTQVFREFTTENGRIDILILTENFVIGIENKINASLYNELSDYSKTIDEVAFDNDIDKENIYKIVLSIKKVKPDNSFINITYKKFFEYIKKNLPEFVFNSDNKYFSFLIDFITTFDKTENMEYNKQLIDFFEKNSENVNKLIIAYNEINSKLLQEFQKKIKIEDLFEKYKTGLTVKNRDFTRKYGYYRNDYHFDKYKFNLQFRISPTEGVRKLYLKAPEKHIKEKSIINELKFNNKISFKPSEVSTASETASKMIRTMIERLENI